MTNFERIQALIELKEKGTISNAEFKQMLELINAEAETTTKKTVQAERQINANKTPLRVKEDITALREKEILAQITNAYLKKDWEMLRAKYELLRNKSAVSLEITTALFAYERRQVWLAKEGKAKKLEEEKEALAKTKKNLLTYGVIVFVIIGICGYIYKNMNSNEQSISTIAQKDKKHYKKPIPVLTPKPKLQLTPQPKPEPKPKPDPTPKIDPERIPEQAQNTALKVENKISDLNDGVIRPFPENLIREAEVLCAKIKNNAILDDEKRMAASRARSIHHDYITGQGTKWLSNMEVTMRLYECALIYKAF
jgi:hypothetical protein